MFFCFLLIQAMVGAQENESYPAGDFISPVDMPLRLSGTFGELRNGHFHSGMDIRTNGSKGYAIRAVADGYVSRVRVAAGGFGKTVYISHPNGYMSVYAHLDRFRSDLEAYVLEAQYLREEFEVNLFPDKGRFRVDQGDVIAFSGNSGYSFGPHLHFEIRENATQEPVNPLHFGFDVEDQVRPTIESVMIYPDIAAYHPGPFNVPREIRIARKGTRHFPVREGIFDVPTDFYVGVMAFDQHNGSWTRNGVYSMKVYLDTLLVYEHRMDRFAFSETRYINSSIDYREFLLNKRRFVRSRLDPNNRLNIYRSLDNGGVIHLEDTLPHILRCVVGDIAGNYSRVDLQVKASDEAGMAAFIEDDSSFVFLSWRDATRLSHQGLEVKIPPYALYDNAFIKIETTAPEPGLLSMIYDLHDSTIPVHRYFSLSIRPDSVPQGREDKLLIAEIGSGGKLSSAGGEWVKDRVVSRLRKFGRYAIAMDTVPPEIHPVNIADGTVKRAPGRLLIRIDDDLSGVATYRSMLNGDWILTEYDLKNKLLICDVQGKARAGRNFFLLEVTDNKNNSAVMEKVLYY